MEIDPFLRYYLLLTMLEIVWPVFESDLSSRLDEALENIIKIFREAYQDASN